MTPITGTDDLKSAGNKPGSQPSPSSPKTDRPDDPDQNKVGRGGPGGSNLAPGDKKPEKKSEAELKREAEEQAAKDKERALREGEDEKFAVRHGDRSGKAAPIPLGDNTKSGVGDALVSVPPGRPEVKVKDRAPDPDTSRSNLRSMRALGANGNVIKSESWDRDRDPTSEELDRFKEKHKAQSVDVVAAD